MFSTDPDTRKAFITGLHDLADYLAASPDVPVPPYGAIINLIAGSADHGGRGQVDRIAALLGTPVHDETADGGHYTADRAFGPVTYCAAAIPDMARARYKAHDSYRGCVTPDGSETWSTGDA
jgi:hypothetical protein